MTHEETADRIEAITARTWNRYGYTSRPTGANYAVFVLDMARELAEAVTPGELTEEVMDILTQDNSHTARHACEIVREILRRDTL